MHSICHPPRTIVARFLVTVLLAACASASGAPSAPAPLAPVLLLPGARELTPGSQLADTLEYSAEYDMPNGGHSTGTGRLETRLTSDAGRPVLMLVRSSSSARGSFADTSFVAANGFAPTRESSYFGGRQRRYAYDGRHVQRAIVPPDSGSGESGHVFDVPVFHFNEVELLARALPLRAGYEAVVPLYSQGDDAIERDTLRVVGEDAHGVWDVRFTDRVIVGTFGIDGATRRILRYDVAAQKSALRGRWTVAPR